jgi:hypothetical protein
VDRTIIWTLGEKEKVVVSILEWYLIPLLWLAHHLGEDETKSFEILNAMYRLSAPSWRASPTPASSL